MNRLIRLCRVIVTGVLALLAAIQVNAAPIGPIPVEESAWRGWTFNHGQRDASWTTDGSQIRLKGSGATQTAVMFGTPFKGQFDLSVAIDKFAGIASGVVLAESRDGQPDPDNWIAMERYGDGERVAVRLYGVRDGRPLNVETPYLPEIERAGAVDHLGNALKQGIIYLTNDTPRLRVLRNVLGGVLHFQFADHRMIDGEMARGWSELPTVTDRTNREYFFGVFAKNLPEGQEAAFSSPSSAPMPLTDEHRAEPEFGATRRGYTWSGYHGDAVVIGFDQRADRPEAKFVFWSEANYIPWWHLNDQLASTYEFVEIWGGDTVGCNEPMSDHLLRWTRANIIESNPARVVVQWDYTLITSDYQWWNNHPTIRPTVRETYTFYPDGAGVRKVSYRPPLEDHETYHKWGHELGEIIAVFGGGRLAREFLPEQALSVFGLDDSRYDYTWDAKRTSGHEWRHQTAEWPAVIVQNHFKDDLPSPFIAFAQDERAREFTAPSGPIQFGSNWELKAEHGPKELTDPNPQQNYGGFSHWPVMKQPYDSRSWIGSKFLREPRHVSLMSITSGPGGTQWPQGPKERTFAMLIGLSDRSGKSEAIIKNRVRSWLYKGTAEVVSPGFEFKAVDYYERAIRFRATKDQSKLHVRVSPQHEWLNPVIIVDAWSPKIPLTVSLAGEALDASRYAISADPGRVIVWIDATIKKTTDIVIESKNTSQSVFEKGSAPLRRGN